jgi:hypothetical protein
VKRLLDDDPVTAEATMTTIERTGRDALDELRRVLGSLREPDRDPELTPQPRVGLLPALLGRCAQTASTSRCASMASHVHSPRASTSRSTASRRRRSAAPSGRVDASTHAVRNGSRRRVRVTIRVLIADDQQLVRTGFRLILEAEADIVVVGEDVAASQLVAGVRMTAAGDDLLAPSITRRLIEQFTEAARAAPPHGYDTRTIARSG